MNIGHVREDFPKAKYKDCYQDYRNQEWDLFVDNFGAKIKFL